VTGRSVIGSLLIVAGIGGCAVGPSTRPPEERPQPVRLGDTLVPPASRAFFDSVAAARQAERPDTASPALWSPEPLTLDSAGDLPWLAVLRDSVLLDLVRTAMTNNRDLRTAVARVREYRAQLGVARGDLFPQLALNGATSTNKAVFGSFPPQKFDIVRATADLSWELDFWGRLRRETQAARFDWLARDDDRRAAVLSLVSDVATAYLELRELDADLGISEQTLVSRQATLGLAQRRFNQGVISELDVRQFEAEVAGPAASLADFARQRTAKENQLSVLLGQEPGRIARGGALDAAVQSVRVPDSVPASLLLRRPDVMSAQRAWQAAAARIGLAVGNRLPKITVTGSYGTQRPNFSGLFGSSAEVYTLQGAISIPLFTGGKLVNQERVARAQAEQARARYEQTVLSALGESSDAMTTLRLSRDQLTAQQTQAQALRRALSLAERRYENGVSSYLEVLDAQRSLFSAELALVQVERQYLVATVQLYKALGGSWEGDGRMAE
jgi:multidrug efflux system outer membrane protein